MRNLSMSIAAIAALATASAVHAEGTIIPIVLDENVLSWDAEGDISNVVMNIDLGLGPNVVINGIGWDMTLETFDVSWASEATIGVGDTLGNVGVYVSPGAGIDDPLPSPTQFTFSTAKLEDFEIPDFTLADGILRLEFFEAFDDVDDVADAQWLSGSTLFVQVAPAPGALALLGAAGLIGRRRRRRA